jgi:ubiquinone/menaquinone biosynthesis C-methylase UbiE
MFWQFLVRLISGRPRPVRLPAGVPGIGLLPDYLLQEMHLLPNGNFSSTITASYAQWFEKATLHELEAARAQIAERLSGASRVLDVGAGSGQVSAALRRAGIHDIVALEPSPYLLQQAARANPGIECVQAVIEDSKLPDRHFDGAAACFVFHEIPPREGNRALSELHRILKPGGRLVIVEPSKTHFSLSWWRVWRRHGFRGLYFKALASRVYEPFVAEWHARDHAAWLTEHGFTVEEDRDCMPWRMLTAIATLRS